MPGPRKRASRSFGLGPGTGVAPSDRTSSLAAPISFTPTGTVMAPQLVHAHHPRCGGPVRHLEGHLRKPVRGRFAQPIPLAGIESPPSRGAASTKIDRIPNWHVVPGSSWYGPNRKNKSGSAYQQTRRERAIRTRRNRRRIRTRATAGLVEARVKDLPTAPEIDFEIRVKVIRWPFLGSW